MIRARCEPYEAATPYYALPRADAAVLEVAADADSPEVERALRDAVAASDPCSGRGCPCSACLLGLDLAATPETEALDEAFLRDRLTEVALRFLATRLAAAPTMLVVEDAQFMDEASRDLLLRLARAGRDMHQVLLVTHSQAGVAWAPSDEEIRVAAIKPAPASARAMTAIAEELTDAAPLQPHEVEQIVERAGGNPLFLQELIETVRRTGSVESLPDSRRGADRRGDRPADGRPTAPYCATPPSSERRSTPALLAEAVREEIELDPGYGTGSRPSSTASPAALLRFRTTLLRDAAYEGLPYRRRRVLHERVGLAIEARPASRSRRRRDAGTPLPRGAALGSGLGLLLPGGRPGDGDLRERRGGPVPAARARRGQAAAGRQPRRARLRVRAPRRRHWRLGEYPSADTAYRPRGGCWPTAPESGER